MQKLLFLIGLLVYSQIVWGQDCPQTDFECSSAKDKWRVESNAIVRVNVQGAKGTGFLINYDAGNVSPYDKPLVLLSGHNFDMISINDSIESEELALAEQAIFEIRYKKLDCNNVFIDAIHTIIGGTIKSISFNNRYSYYDYALVELNEAIPHHLRDEIPLLGLDMNWDAQQYDKLSVLHHPDGKSLKLLHSPNPTITHDDIDFKVNKSALIDGSLVGGSSGGPWLNQKSHAVIGLHKGASPNSTCNSGESYANRIFKVVNDNNPFNGTARFGEVIGFPEYVYPFGESRFPTYIGGDATLYGGFDKLYFKADGTVNVNHYQNDPNGNKLYDTIIEGDVVIVDEGIEIGPRTFINNKYTTSSSQLKTSVTTEKQKGISNEKTSGARFYPNPFAEKISIQYDVGNAKFIQIDILNLLGQPIKKLYKGTPKAGKLMVDWDGTNESNVQVPSGVYLCSIKDGNQVNVHRIVFTK